MKILFLNPKIDAEHKISRALQEQGIALLFPLEGQEAIQMLQLHGESVDLGIIHREGPEGGQTNPGLEWIRKIKATPSQADLPIILTTDTWNDEECASHQNSGAGVNAYLRTPFDAKQLIEMIEAVLGKSLGGPSAPQPSLPKDPDLASDSEHPILEDLSEVLLVAEEPAPRDDSIFLEAPQEELGSGKLEPKESSLSIPMGALPPEELDLSALSLPVPPSELPESGTVAPLEMTSLSSSNFSIPDASQKGIDQKLHLQDSSLRPDSDDVDQEAAQEMPYLFRASQKNLDNAVQLGSSFLFAEPLGDAVVPGGAAQSPDLETIKKYLFLREQDVAALSTQLKASRDQILSIEKSNREEKAKNGELTHIANEQKQKIENFEREKRTLIENLQLEINELKFQVKAKTDKARVLENQVREVLEEMNHLKDRVRSDIRKIRVREKELENRLEIMKKDSEALIGARENKIIELKRKLDLLEFNMDLLQDQYSREKDNAVSLRERLARVAQAVRVAGGLLDSSKGENSHPISETPHGEENEEKIS